MKPQTKKSAKQTNTKTTKGETMKTNEAKRDIYQEVTDRIVAALERGTAPWVRPWKADDAHVGVGGMFPHNAATGRKYHGVNAIVLWSSGFASQGWMTFNQAKAVGAKVRKGEKSTPVVFWKPMMRKLREGEPGFVAGEERTKKTFMLRYYNVFNVEQLDDYEVKTAKQPEPVEMPEGEMLAIAQAAGAKISHGGNTACYSPVMDWIQMPKGKAFKSTPHYNATLAHELTHWTGHKSRCDRDLTGRFGDDSYAFEELVAELGSSFFAAHFGFENSEVNESAASYIQSWVKRCKEDKYAIFKASSLAKAAVAFVADAAQIELEPKAKTEDDETDDADETATEQATA